MIDLGSRLRSAFGYASANQSSSLQAQGFADQYSINEAGVFVSDSSFEELTIKQNNDSKLVFASLMQSNSLIGNVYAPPPMVSFSKGKNITETEIDGTDAVVVERYGDKSWVIKLQGVLVDMVNHRYPKQQVIQLREFFDLPKPFAVEGEMFDDLKIKSIYFTNIEIGGVAGYEDTIQYSLDAKSIKPVEFFFAKKNN
jgi:hypothetical protein